METNDISGTSRSKSHIFLHRDVFAEEHPPQLQKPHYLGYPIIGSKHGLLDFSVNDDFFIIATIYDKGPGDFVKSMKYADPKKNTAEDGHHNVNWNDYLGTYSKDCEMMRVRESE